MSIPRWIRTCVPNLVLIGPAIWQISHIFNCWPPKTPKFPLRDTGQIFILPTTFSRWICMCVPNLVPIGPQTATCIRLEGYTHARTHARTHTHTHNTHTHTLSLYRFFSCFVSFARPVCMSSFLVHGFLPDEMMAVSQLSNRSQVV